MSLGPTLTELLGVPADALRVTSGTVRVRQHSVGFRWFESPHLPANCTPVVLVALHGGPAFTSGYIEPLALAAVRDPRIRVLFYDQAGCGRSSRYENVRDEAPELLTIDYYVRELDQVLEQLVPGPFYLYGSSWGTVLAQEWAVFNCGQARPRPLRALVLDGALNDANLYIESQWRAVLARYVPDYTLRRLRKLEDEKAYDSPEYRAIESSLGARFTMRVVPAPRCWTYCLENQCKEIYVAMQGASEFTVGGALENWTIRGRIGVVRCPALVLAGEFDTMSKECQEAVVADLPCAWPLVTIEKAAHCKLIDAPEACCNHIVRFIHSVESSCNSGNSGNSINPNQSSGNNNGDSSRDANQNNNNEENNRDKQRDEKDSDSEAKPAVSNKASGENKDENEDKDEDEDEDEFSASYDSDEQDIFAAEIARANDNISWLPIRTDDSRASASSELADSGSKSMEEVEDEVDEENELASSEDADDDIDDKLSRKRRQEERDGKFAATISESNSRQKRSRVAKDAAVSRQLAQADEDYLAALVLQQHLQAQQRNNEPQSPKASAKASAKASRKAKKEPAKAKVKPSPKLPRVERGKNGVRVMRYDKDCLDANGEPRLPRTYGTVKILSLGKIVKSPGLYHSKFTPFPIGFKSQVTFESMTTRGCNATYTNEILLRDNNLLFAVTPSDGECVVGKSASSVWHRILSQVNQLNGRTRANTVSGPRKFGFSLPTVQFLVRRLPGADALPLTSVQFHPI